MARTSHGAALDGERDLERRAMVEVSREVKALESLTLTQLQAKHLALFGMESRTKNKAFLQKKLAWRIQERAEGGLSAEATDRIAELAPTQLPTRTEPKQRPTKSAVSATTNTSKPARDERLPVVGTILQREYQGVIHEVEILAQGFRFQDRIHRSLSSIAKTITGTNWNGREYRYYRCVTRGKRVPPVGRRNFAQWVSISS